MQTAVYGLITEFPNYVITEDGRVINTVTGAEKTQSLGKNGYRYVTLYRDNTGKKLYIHRLLGLAFIPNFYNKRTINHIDGNKLNNKLCNLEWATYGENTRHSYTIDGRKTSSKLSEADKLVMYVRFMNGENMTKIAYDYPCNNVTVSNHIRDYVKSLPEAHKLAYESEKRRQRKCR